MDPVDGLRLFIRVVETGSFSKASAGLGITQPTATQPTATQHVAALEAQQGARCLGTNLADLLAAARVVGRLTAGGRRAAPQSRP